MEHDRGQSRPRRNVACVPAVLVALALPAGASAATIGVTTTDDTVAADGLCSLREAVTAANTNASTGGCPAGGSSSPDRIELPAGTYELMGASGEDANASGDLDVDEAVEIAGAGASMTTIDAFRHDRVIDVAEGAGNALTVESLSITAGQSPNNADTVAQTGGEPGGAIRGAGGGTSITVRDATLYDNHTGDGNGTYSDPVPRRGGDGGAIFSAGELTIRRTTFRGNGAGDGGFGGALGKAGGGWGGAVAALGPLTIAESTFSGNYAGEDHGGGGAVYVGGGAPAAITSSTFAGNSPGFARCCGIGAGGAIAAFGPVRIAGSTISNNTANREDIAGGGAVYVGGTGAVRIDNSIVAGNGDDTTSGPYGQDEITGDQTVSLRFSLIGMPPSTPFDDVAGSQIGTDAPLDPGLGTLADNGGPTKTMAPDPSSPAIDAGSAFGLTTDQRGSPRPVDYANVASVPGGDGSDIGAVELASPPDAIPPELAANSRKVLEAKGGRPPRRVTVSLSSNEDCTARVSGAVKAGDERAKLRSTRVEVPDDRSRVTAKLRLPNEARKVAAEGLAHGAVRVKLAVSCTDAAGNTAERALSARIESRRAG